MDNGKKGPSRENRQVYIYEGLQEQKLHIVSNML